MATTYDAFLSYSHAGDQPLARALERALQRYAKPWNQRRAMEIFRDDTNLNLSPHLWASIQQALDSSRFFLCIASPEAAGSPLVAKEVAHWKQHRDMRQFIVLLACGEVVWDPATGDCDAIRSTALSPELHGAFEGEPLYLDLRWTRGDPVALSLENPRFREEVVRIAATLRGVSVEDLIGEQVDLQRRSVRRRNAVIAALSILTVVALAAAGLALTSRSDALRAQDAAVREQHRAESATVTARTAQGDAERRRREAEAAEQRATDSASLAEDRARETAEQRTIAEREAHAARVALAEANIRAALPLVKANRTGEALAMFARALRTDPDSVPALSWISDLFLSGQLWAEQAVFSDQGELRRARFSRDARLVVTASANGTARIWDVATGRPYTSALRHRAAVLDAVFSPDGKQVATASADTTAGVWDVATGTPGQTFRHPDRVRSVEFSADGRLLLTTSFDWTVRVWNAATGAPAGSPIRLDDLVAGATLSSDARQIVAVTTKGAAHIWNAATGTQVCALEGPAGGFSSASFSPDPGTVRTTTREGLGILWDAGDCRRRAVPPERDAVNPSALSPDGRFLVTVEGDFAHVRDATTRAILGTLPHPWPVSDATFSPDGSTILTTADHAARLWTRVQTTQARPALQHRAQVHNASFSRDGRFVLTAAWDNVAGIWDAETGLPVGAPMRAPTDVDVAAFSPDGRLVAVGARGNHVRIYAVATRQLVTPLLTHDAFITSVAFSPDSRRVLSTSPDRTVRVWDASTGQPVGEPLRHAAGVMLASFSPDGTRILTASRDNTARVWDPRTGRPIGAVLQHNREVRKPEALPDGVLAAAFSPDGRYVVTASVDRTARLWRAATGKPVGVPLRHRASVTAAAFSADGRRVHTASIDGTARSWDIATGLPVGGRIDHRQAVQSAAFSPDGSRLVTAGSDGSARVWDVATGLPIGMAHRHRDRINSVTFSPDGRRIATASDDQTGQIWDVMLATGSLRDREDMAVLAEVVGGHRMTDFSSVVPLSEAERRARIRQLVGSISNDTIHISALVRGVLVKPKGGSSR